MRRVVIDKLRLRLPILHFQGLSGGGNGAEYRIDTSAFLRLAVVVSLPQIYGRLRNNSEKKAC